MFRKECFNPVCRGNSKKGFESGSKKGKPSRQREMETKVKIRVGTEKGRTWEEIEGELWENVDGEARFQMTT
jgi:hypothetical protein